MRVIRYVDIDFPSLGEIYDTFINMIGQIKQAIHNRDPTLRFNEEHLMPIVTWRCKRWTHCFIWLSIISIPNSVQQDLGKWLHLMMKRWKTTSWRSLGKCVLKRNLLYFAHSGLHLSIFVVQLLANWRRGQIELH